MFGLSWIRLAIYAAIAAATVAAVTWAVGTYNESLREEGRAEIRAAVAAERAQLAELSARETARRLERQQENANAFLQDRDRAAADAARARDAAGQLRDHVDTLERIARGAGASDSAALASRQAADTAARMLADLQRRADERAGLLAEYADRARLAGQLCERDYDALTVR
jgi:hypothetical protein